MISYAMIVSAPQQPVCERLDLRVAARSDAWKICQRSCCARPSNDLDVGTRTHFLLQDEDGNMHLRNLSVNLAASEEVESE